MLLCAEAVEADEVGKLVIKELRANGPVDIASVVAAASTREEEEEEEEEAGDDEEEKSEYEDDENIEQGSHKQQGNA
jgi:hypothetical protein